MIALDTNVLVYAHRAELPLHEQSASGIRRLAETSAAWAIPWPCVHEFLAIVTNVRIFATPSSVAVAFEQLVIWTESPSLVLLAETDRHLSTLAALVTSAHISGPKVHDARVAAICVDHGVQALVTQDRDFSRFPVLKTRSVLEWSS